MRELKVYQDPDDYELIFYDKESDGDSEKAMWRLDQILYELKPGDVLKISCEE